MIRRKAVVLGAATTCLLATGAVALDTHSSAPGAGYISHTQQAVVRSNRAVLAGLHCFYDYHTTMTRPYSSAQARRDAMDDCHWRSARRALRVIERNGGVYIKLGQHLSAMGYLIPSQWVRTMECLQDRCPPSTFDDIMGMFREDTGMDPDDVFESFERVPLGVASLAQVHRATLRSNGQVVAVKMQHPSVAEFSHVDIKTTRFVLHLIDRFFPDFALTWLGDELETSLPIELDFRLEAENATRSKRYFEKLPRIPLYIPDVIWARKRILVMEFIQGERIDNLEYMKECGISREQVSSDLARIFNEMIFKSGFVHVDPHGGNILIRHRGRVRGLWPLLGGRKNYEIVLLDHGLYRHIPLDYRISYANLWLAIIESNEEDMRRYAKVVAGIDDDLFPIFASAITGKRMGMLGKKKKRTGDVKGMQEEAEEEEGGLFLSIVELLSHVPRIMLFLFKTNDLTRSLDASLEIDRSGYNFTIMGMYCASAVCFGDWSSKGLWSRVKCWVRYAEVYVRLHLYRAYLAVAA